MDPSERDRDSAERGDPDDLQPCPDLDLRRRLLRAGLRRMAPGSLLSLLKPLYDPWYRHCVQCGGSLGRDGELYYVERALRSGEPLFEYAMCEGCVLRFHGDLSVESQRKITALWIERFDARTRRARLDTTQDPSVLVDRCALTGRRREELDEYQVWAWFREGVLAVDEYVPAILSFEAVEEVQQLLSRQTRDQLDDFVRDRLGLPPELQRLPVLV